jgi:hypothetical protein
VRALSFSPAVPPTCHKQRVTSGIQRTITVTRIRLLGRASVPDLRWGRSPKLHGMQVFPFGALAIDFPDEDAPTPMNRVNEPVKRCDLPRP